MTELFCYLLHSVETSNRRFCLYVLPALLYAATIATLSSLPDVAPPPLGMSWDDKIYHFIEYFGFSLFLFRMFGYWEKTREALRRILLTVLSGAVFGALDELHQLFIRGRYAELTDWLANSVGILFGIITIIVYERTHSRLRRT
jgi:VanZ family protein